MPPPSNKSGKIQPKHTNPEGSVGKLFIKSDIGARKRRRRRFGDSEVDESVYEDFARGLGFRPASIREVYSRETSP